MLSKHRQIERLFSRYPALSGIAKEIEDFTDELILLYSREGTLFLAGTGGSAAACDHICGELLKGFKSKRPLDEKNISRFEEYFGEAGKISAQKLQNGFRAISLLSHGALLSAFGNDVDPDLAFAQQLWALGREGDVFLGISTGGNAKNIVNAMMAAKVKGITTVLLTGNRHGVAEKYADIVIAVPESETFIIQEYHLPIYHAVALAVEDFFFKNMQ